MFSSADAGTSTAITPVATIATAIIAAAAIDSAAAAAATATTVCKQGFFKTRVESVVRVRKAR